MVNGMLDVTESQRGLNNDAAAAAPAIVVVVVVAVVVRVAELLTAPPGEQDIMRISVDGWTSSNGCDEVAAKLFTLSAVFDATTATTSVAVATTAAAATCGHASAYSGSMYSPYLAIHEAQIRRSLSAVQ